MVLLKIGNVGGSETAAAKSRCGDKWLLDARESWEEKNARHLQVGQDFNHQRLSMLYGNCDNCMAVTCIQNQGCIEILNYLCNFFLNLKVFYN